MSDNKKNTEEIISKDKKGVLPKVFLFLVFLFMFASYFVLELTPQDKKDPDLAKKEDTVQTALDDSYSVGPEPPAKQDINDDSLEKIQPISESELEVVLDNDSNKSEAIKESSEEDGISRDESADTEPVILIASVEYDRNIDDKYSTDNSELVNADKEGKKDADANPESPEVEVVVVVNEAIDASAEGQNDINGSINNEQNNKEQVLDEKNIESQNTKLEPDDENPNPYDEIIEQESRAFNSSALKSKFNDYRIFIANADRLVAKYQAGENYSTELKIFQEQIHPSHIVEILKLLEEYQTSKIIAKKELGADSYYSINKLFDKFVKIKKVDLDAPDLLKMKENIDERMGIFINYIHSENLQNNLVR